ncbi:MAG TPA: prepilin-type N-terminal cleavage/methylation domain-containing protein [Candidatus Deferrimicrobium sp.]|nr:prepilin-type N-terminal cleavage/methylation domain-containing protein [Candidatus Deferrimicrobium sp.]
MISSVRSRQGFTLIELIIVIIALGVVAAVAVRNLSVSIETAKVEQTKQELDQLAYAIVGNPAVYANGARGDFGYVGDIGALPPGLDALGRNPGAYSTWDGPYIDTGLTGAEYLADAWGANYVYTDTMVRSVGSGSNIDKVFAARQSDLLSNSVSGVVVDAGGTSPGSIYKDSLILRLTYPNGAGSTATVSANPDAAGYFRFADIPIGLHRLAIIYAPDTDTATYTIAVNPAGAVKLSIVFPAELW